MKDANIQLLIKNEIKKNGHNNSSLAEAIGVSEGTIRRITNINEDYNPTLRVLRGISTELRIPMETLTGEDE